VILRRLLSLGLVALALAAATASASAQSFVGREAGGTMRAASALAERIRAYHRGPGRWMGYTPVPPGYCGTMREGEAVLKELSRLASRAVLYRLPGLALELQAVGNRLGDALDEEEVVNLAADIPYTVFPCPVENTPYPAPRRMRCGRRSPRAARSCSNVCVEMRRMRPSLRATNPEISA
jgi:hypothetical protein